MCLVLDLFLWGHSSRVCDISCYKIIHFFMQFSAIVNRHNLILLLQTPFLEKKFFWKMFIVADLVSLTLSFMNIHAKLHPLQLII